VWTDGTKLAVVATHGSAVLIWNSMPRRDHQPPDLVLRPRDAGTPRNITSDGSTFFALSDHNNGPASRPATMVWRPFPTRGTDEPVFQWGEWIKGTITRDGPFIAAGGRSIFIWTELPRDEQVDANVVLRPPSYRNGDGPDAVVASGRLYVCNYNGNTVLGWNSLPTRDHEPPDFAIGSDHPEQDPWAENYFIQNPVVATDGKSLFVSSDFDRKMFVWRSLPDESGAKPDLVFHLPEGPWDSELHGQTLALAGRNTVYVWRKLPLDGEPPDLTLAGRIGSVRLEELTGVAFDDRYFYLADRRSETISVWDGIPTSEQEPRFTLAMRSPGRLTSDGQYLAAAPFEGQTFQWWRVGELGQRAEAIPFGRPGQFNLPSECLMAGGRVFVANRSFNRVDVWNRIDDALAGGPADAMLGAADGNDRKPAIGRNRLFMPGSLAFDGSRLWVGEFKFSARIVRFSPVSASPVAAQSAAAPPPPRVRPAIDRSAPSTSQDAGQGRRPRQPTTRADGTLDLATLWSQGRAAGRGPVRFTHSPMRLADIERLTPYGLMVGGHVCPIDHGYFYPKALKPGQEHFDVFAPADGFVVQVGHRTQLTGSSDRDRPYDDYALVIEHSSTFYTQYDLLTKLDAAILDRLDAPVRERFARKEMGPAIAVRIPVRAGQPIGKVGGRSLDFGVVNTEVRLPGFLNPRLYGHYAWRVHVVDPFDYFHEPLKSELLKLNPRKTKPYFGKIDYDVDGRLVGNWFLAGSGGYPGDHRDPRGYWMGHLAFAYHHIDPSLLIVSIGDFDGRPRQFAVRGNGPDPADVSVETGPVKYELVYAPINSSGESIELPTELRGVQGVMLVQLVENRRVKLEVFPRKASSEVSGFTTAATTYER
jgi:hypothetical protein